MILEVDVGFAMIFLMRQLHLMLKSVVVFQKPDPNLKIKLIFFSIAVLILELPIILSWIYYSD